jgi:hypothetical protein
MATQSKSPDDYFMNLHSFAPHVKNFGLFATRENGGLFAPRFRRFKTMPCSLNTRLVYTPINPAPSGQCVPQSHSAAPIVLYAGRLPTAAWLTILEFVPFEHQMTQFARVSRDLNAGMTFRETSQSLVAER